MLSCVEIPLELRETKKRVRKGILFHQKIIKAKKMSHLWGNVVPP